MYKIRELIIMLKDINLREKDILTEMSLVALFDT